MQRNDTHKRPFISYCHTQRKYANRWKIDTASRKLFSYINQYKKKLQFANIRKRSNWAEMPISTLVDINSIYTILWCRKSREIKCFKGMRNAWQIESIAKSGFFFMRFETFQWALNFEVSFSKYKKYEEQSGIFWLCD